MLRSRIHSVVVTTAVLNTLNFIIAHIMRQSTVDNYIWGNPGVKNFTELLNSEGYRCTSPNFNFGNNGAPITPFPAPFTEEGPFYTAVLPRTVFIYALLVPLQYYWNLRLDKWWPTRPRPLYLQSQKPRGGEGVDNNYNDQKAAIKRFTAEEKVRRPSVSTRNVFVKWMLDINGGTILFEILRHALDVVIPNFGLSSTKSSLAWVSSARFTCSTVHSNSLMPSTLTQ